MKQGYPVNCIDPQLYSALNSQTYYTCYPPFLQAIFGISTWLAPHNIYANIVMLKTFILAAEIGSIIILVRLSAQWGFDRQRVLLYVLNPIVIAELTGNLHYEGVMIFFLLASIYCWQKNRIVLGALLFSIAIITKLVPLMLLPVVFFNFGKKKGFLICAGILAVCIIGFLPFMDIAIVQKFWSSIDSYFQESEFNASIYYLVNAITYRFTSENMINIIGPALTIISGVLIIVYSFVKSKRINVKTLSKYFTWILLIYYAFTTTVFPWYITPMILFSVFTDYKFPLVWSAMIVLSYYADRNALFEESKILLWIEYGVLGACIGYDLYNEQKKKLNPVFI
ncbi:MAG: DUF2029 domain-containing protein [Taibaiella sp.]|nr:DUF2029 domain-containing protein [Taibaiella sp.]